VKITVSVILSNVSDPWGTLLVSEGKFRSVMIKGVYLMLILDITKHVRLRDLAFSQWIRNRGKIHRKHWHNVKNWYIA